MIKIRLDWQLVISLLVCIYFIFGINLARRQRSSINFCVKSDLLLKEEDLSIILRSLFS